MVVNDQAVAFGDTYTVTATTLTRTVFGGLTYGTVEGLTLNAESGNNTINVNGTAAVCLLTVNAGAGNDTINVGRTASSLVSGISLDACHGAVSLNGQAGTDVLNINDQAAAAGHTYTLDGSTLSRDGAAAITFALETVNLTASGHDDKLILNALPAGVVMNIDLGLGYNRVYGPDTANTWLINGYSGGEGRAVLNDIYTINGITGLAGGTAPDRFVFMPGGYIPSVINGAGGGDTLDYSLYNTGATVNLGAYGGGTYGSATGVGSSVSNIRTVIGSPYNDVLTGNIYGNVLVGGAGNDKITGGTGRSILIGGLGADTIRGQSGNDLIIGGYTAYDLDPTALDAIFAEWASSEGLDQRKLHLKGPVGHLNGSHFLISSGTGRTVFDDGAGDSTTIVGGSNWIIPS